VGGLACSGSTEKLNPIQGKVLFKNQPLKGALVTFHPKGADDPKKERPTGLTREDGTFTVTTGQKEGAPAGQYVITIICSEVPETASKGISTGGVEAQDRLQGAYAMREKSTIQVEIKKGINELTPFELK
jgi:hypothetical protein